MEVQSAIPCRKHFRASLDGTAEGSRPHMEASTSANRQGTRGGKSLHCVGLLFRHVADCGELVHLALICFERQENQQTDGCQGDQRVQREGQENQERDHGHDPERDVKNKRGHTNEDALK